MYQKQKKYFITFGADHPAGQYYLSSDDYIAAIKRLGEQAESLDLFDKIILYTDTHLKNDQLFWDKHGKFISNNKRGYGYWIWKPYIIGKTMAAMEHGDILTYIDAGCEIDINKKNILNNHFEHANRDYIVGSLTDHCEKNYNKMDLVLRMDMREHYKYHNWSYRQRQSGLLMFLVNDDTKKIVREWYEIACDYHMLDDTPSVNENIHSFNEHRHDQSIFSLLVKKYDIFSEESLEDCVEISRNRTGVSIL